MSQSKELARKAAQKATGLKDDDRAQASRGVEVVVGLMVAGIVGAFLLPIAINELVAVDTSSWSSGASSLWDIMDVIVVLALFLFFIGIALKATNRI